MGGKRSFGRREFLITSGAALGLIGAEADFQLARSGGTGSDLQSIHRRPEQLRQLLERMDASGYRFLSVPRKDGEFLHFLIKMTRSRNVLEIGTSHGYSALWMGLGLEETDGRLTTIEINRERHELARRHIGEAGLSKRVTLLRADAHVELTKIEGLFDFVFMDADKDGQVDYFRKLYPEKLVPGGMIAVHNAIRQADSMKDYLDMIRRHSGFDTITVSATMEDGFCLSCRHRT